MIWDRPARMLKVPIVIHFLTPMIVSPSSLSENLNGTLSTLQYFCQNPAWTGGSLGGAAIYKWQESWQTSSFTSLPHFLMEPRKWGNPPKCSCLRSRAGTACWLPPGFISDIYWRRSPEAGLHPCGISGYWEWVITFQLLPGPVES